MDQAPILPPSRPLLRDVYHGQIEHLEQAVVHGENGLGFRHLTELAVKALNGVGGVKFWNIY